MFTRLSRAVVATGMILLLSACLDRSQEYAECRVDSPGTVGTPARLSDVVVSDPSAEFSRIASVAAASDGTVFVADDQSARITVLDPGGAVRARVGGRGGGPGEFQEPRAVQALPGDSLMVFDFSGLRVTVFEPETYEVAYTRRMDVPPTAARPEWFARVLDPDLFVAAFVEFVRADRPPAPEEDESTGVRLVRTFHLDGSLLRDSVFIGPRARWLLVRRGGVIGIAGSHPFGPDAPITLGADDRMYIGWSGTDTVRVEAYTLNGDSSGFLSIPCRSTEVTARDVEHAVEESSPIFHDAIREAVPDRWPAVRDLTADDEGRLWVTLGGPPTDSTRAWVVGTDGELAFPISLPPGATIEDVRGDRIHTVVLDEFDVPRVETWAYAR